MNHEITLAQGIDLTKRFRDLRPTVINPIYANTDIVANSETFDRAAIDALLEQNDCQKIRIYYGMTPDLKIHAVLVGVNSDDEDILPAAGSPAGLIMEGAMRCPTDCPPPSALNS
jgi:hypothetical protein